MNITLTVVVAAIVILITALVVITIFGTEYSPENMCQKCGGNYIGKSYNSDSGFSKGRFYKCDNGTATRWERINVNYDIDGFPVNDYNFIFVCVPYSEIPL